MEVSGEGSRLVMFVFLVGGFRRLRELAREGGSNG